MSPVRSHPDGDNVRIDVRLVVAPVAGIFAPADLTSDAGLAGGAGRLVAAEGLIGHIGGPESDEPVRSFCEGILIQVMAEQGERVRVGQPLAWLQPSDTRSAA